MRARDAGDSVTTVDLIDAGLVAHQLFFVRMDLKRPTREPATTRQDQIGRPRMFPPGTFIRPRRTGIQPRLFDVRPDFTRVTGPAYRDLTNSWLRWAQHLAQRRGEAMGWTPRLRYGVQQGLNIVLSAHIEGDTIRYSELLPALLAHHISVGRVAEVLDELGVYVDDRPPLLEVWLEERLDGLAPGIRTDVEEWLRALHNGGPRTPPRSSSTVQNRIYYVLPPLQAWSSRYQQLRQVTRDDVAEIAGNLQGNDRVHTLTTLRSLFAFCKKNGTIFRNPTTGIRVGTTAPRIPIPLAPDELSDAATTITSPAGRVVLALAAIHAARIGDIRQVRLDDVDLGNRRLTIAGRTRPLDDLTRDVIVAWLQHRRDRWPNTANPHLIISRQSAMDIKPVSHFWGNDEFRRLKVTLEQLRIDRQLEEALTHGPDPLHLAAVFGLSEATAVRYANAARQLLATPAEEDLPGIMAFGPG